MGIYLNPGNGRFEESIASQIYVDKSELIAYTNQVIGTEQKYICVSRPRRFGKSMTANMLAAYYDRKSDSSELFKDLKIAQDFIYEKHRNKYNVIFLNMQDFLSRVHDVKLMQAGIEKSVLWDLLEEYPDFRYFDKEDLTRTLMDVHHNTKIPFVFIIDEWDCIFREKQNDKEAQRYYLDFLRNLLKDKSYVKLAYMTGILPIKKYGTHKVNSTESGREDHLGGSALNMFDEFSMTAPDCLAEFVGFTEEEVWGLCQQYQMDFDEVKRWYDGYRFDDTTHVYSPRSVVRAMLSHKFGNYWTQTESYEALKVYIEMNYDSLKDMIIELLAGGRRKVNTAKFTNDMTSFQNAEDVLTLLVHLGYLGYDVTSEEVFIPNSEVSGEFLNAVEGAGWDEVGLVRGRCCQPDQREEICGGIGRLHRKYTPGGAKL